MDAAPPVLEVFRHSAPGPAAAMHSPVRSDLRRMLAQALATAEREYREAQVAVARDATDEARARYARAERNYRKVEALLKEAGAEEPEKPLQAYVFAPPSRRRS